MMDAYLKGIRPSVFLRGMAWESVKDIQDPVERRREYRKAYNRLSTDWYNRRLGPNGWLRKLDEYESHLDALIMLLYSVQQIKQKCMRIIRDPSTRVGDRLRAMDSVMKAIRWEMRLRGLKSVNLWKEDEAREEGGGC